MCCGWMAGESEPWSRVDGSSGHQRTNPFSDDQDLHQVGGDGWKECAKGWFSKFECNLMFLPRELSFWLCWQFSHSHALDFFGDKLRCVVRWQGRSQVFNLRPRNSPVLITINPRSVLNLLQYIVASQTLHMREESGSLWLWCNYEEVKKALTQPRKTLMHDEIEHKECDGDDFYNIVIVYWYCI